MDAEMKEKDGGREIEVGGGCLGVSQVRAGALLQR
jgi:hypothetical protein